MPTASETEEMARLLNDEWAVYEQIMQEPRPTQDQLDADRVRLNTEWERMNDPGIKQQYQYQMGPPSILARLHNKVMDILKIKSFQENLLLEDAVCVRLNYCESIKKYEHEIDMCKALLDGIASIHWSFPIPASTLTVYIVKHRMLDRICKCPE